MSNLLVWFKAKLLLILIAIVWTSLLFLTWRGWWQVLISLLAVVIPPLQPYRYVLWIAQDQDVNVLIRGGNPDVTISSKVGYMKINGSKTAAAMAVVIDLIFRVFAGQKNHCVASIEHDEEHYDKWGRK